jgi:hypothetical protein
LNEGYDVSLNFIDRPPKGCAHPFEFDGRERLEIQNDGRIMDQIR